jgi:NAD(P)-dependent dehydrogenase (short-subunit alcohol dehydrogenase family)
MAQPESWQADQDQLRAIALGTPAMKQVLLVTGGSRGIGAATARLAAAKGYAVCLSYINGKAAADAVVADIGKAGGAALAVQADVAQEADILRLFAETDAAFGPLTALVNNAGIIEPHMRVDAFDAARLARIFATNITGSFLCAREAVRRMSTRHGGSGGGIVNLSSVAARLGAPGEYVDYAASKGAIDSFTLGLAKEVAAEDIRVNAVRPGLIYTDIHASGGEPGRVERLQSAIPMQRGGSAEEVAAAILWLLSDEASYVTGTVLEVTGGR